MSSRLCALALLAVAGCGSRAAVDFDAGDSSDPDLGVGDPTDLSTVDLADLRKAPYDFTIIRKGCFGTVNCINDCPQGDNGCTDNCLNAATPTGKQMFNDLLNCLDSFCPFQVANDPCFDQGSAKCSSCWAMVQAMGGDCHAQAEACYNDLP